MFSRDGDIVDSDRFLLMEPRLEETGSSTSAAAIIYRAWYVILFNQKTVYD